MRKVILLCTLIGTLNISAQENFGVFAGVNYSYFTDGFQKEIQAEDSFGIQFGILYNLSLSQKINFRPKLSYSQQGDRIESGRINGTGIDLSEIDSKLNYLNASLDFKFWDKIYVVIGPQIGFLLNQKSVAFNSPFIDKDVDFGLNLGGGFEVNNLFFELGFYQGLTTLLTLPKSFSSSFLDIRNSLFKFTAGYNF